MKRRQLDAVRVAIGGDELVARETRVDDQSPRIFGAQHACTRRVPRGEHRRRRAHVGVLVIDENRRKTAHVADDGSNLSADDCDVELPPWIDQNVELDRLPAA